MNRKSFMITTPIYYVNAEPHLGTAYTTIAADSLSRWKRMDGENVYFLTGLDEHGQKIAQAAEAAGQTPQDWADAIAPKFKAVWESLNITNDDFIRTTEPRHVRGVQAFWADLYEAGWLYKGGYEGWYCIPDETFHTEEALVDGKCPDCGRDVEYVREENWFFKLSEFGDRLLAYYDEHPEFIAPETRRNEIVSFVKGGLKDLSISRTTFTWGVPLPFDEGHVTYVWIDALLNYITAVGYGDPSQAEEFAYRWPAQVHFVGKDITRFHCVIWPAMLMAAGLAIPEKVFAHGFLLTKGEKMSKSRGNAMAPLELAEKFGVDGYRYYFLSDVQFGSDGAISLERMIQVYNADLANSWGNLCSRAFNMAGKYFDGRVPAVDPSNHHVMESPLKSTAEGLYERYRAAMDAIDYSTAASAAQELVAAANLYVEESAPWNLAKNEETAGDLAAVIYNLLEAIRIAAIFFAPFMPATSAEVWRRMGLGDVNAITDTAAESQWGRLSAGNPVEKGEALFPRIQAEDVE